jgi:potassium-dependent mechanosensitive channel
MTVRLAGAALSVALTLSCVPSLAADSPPTPAAAPATGQAAAPAAAPPSLGEMVTTAEAVNATLEGIRRRLQSTERFTELSAKLQSEQEAFVTLQTKLVEAPIDRAGLYELIDLGVAIRSGSERIAAVVSGLAARAKALDADLEKLTAIEQQWGANLDTAKARNAPPAMVDGIRDIVDRGAALAESVAGHRNEILIVLERATRLQGAATDLKNAVEDQREQLRLRLKTAHTVPIWEAELRPEVAGRVQVYFKTGAARGMLYFRGHALLLTAIAMLSFGLTYWLIVATRGRIAQEAETNPQARSIAQLFRRPSIAALLAAMLALLWLAPVAPMIFYHVLWALLPIPAAILAREVGGSHFSLSLFTLAVALISLALLNPLDLLPLTGRLVVIAQCLAVGGALAWDLRRGRFAQSFTRIPLGMLKAVVVSAIILLAASALANVVGYEGISRTLRDGVLGSLGFALVLRISAHLLYGLSLALMETRAAQRLHIVRSRPYSVQRALRGTLGTAGVLLWAAGTLLAFGLLENLFALLGEVRGTVLKIGSAAVSLENVLAGLLVLAATWALVRVVRLVLEVEVLPRLYLKTGTPFAISTMIRYLLVTTGTVLAMAAMGIDLTKVTLLAGALGVGIGFGLQSTVNNFVSGVILLMERPIHIGDMIQMENLWGEVKRIGVRSSTVRTFQGAEVIVPNADLISKEVTNWTLSDRRRRLEIDVGTAYGSDPAKVLRALEAAAREVKEVLDDPAPFAWFTGFGDSSLDFRLHAWIVDYDRGLVNQTALRIAIYNKLKEAEIEIPFPQRDIHIRTTPGGPPDQPSVGAAGTIADTVDRCEAREVEQ